MQQASAQGRAAGGCGAAAQIGGDLNAVQPPEQEITEESEKHEKQQIEVATQGIPINLEELILHHKHAKYWDRAWNLPVISFLEGMQTGHILAS